MTSIDGNDVFKIHGVAWDEEDFTFTIRASLLGSKDIDEIIIDNEGVSYCAYEDRQSVLPYYIEAPDTIKNIMQFNVVTYQSIVKALLFSVIYPVFCATIEYQKMTFRTKELSILVLHRKIHSLYLSRIRIAGTEDPDRPIEKCYRLLVEEKPAISTKLQNLCTQWRLVGENEGGIVYEGS